MSVDHKRMTFEQSLAHFSERNFDLSKYLSTVKTREDLNLKLNTFLGNMWEDKPAHWRLAKDIEAYLLAQGFPKEAINLTNTKKGWQRHKEINGMNADPTERLRIWFARMQTSLLRLFHRGQ